jgi:hypothetical protein
MKVHVFSEERLCAVYVELFHFLPLLIFVCHLAPASLADGAFFSSEEDVEFNFVVFAFVIPWVLTMFHVCESPLMLCWSA